MSEFIGADPLELDRLRVGVTHMVGAHTQQTMKFSEMRDRITDDMVLRLEAEVLAEKLPPDVAQASTTVMFWKPASWVQHLKESCYRWRRLWRLKKWFPVQYVVEQKKVALTVNLQRYHTYPEASIVAPDPLGRPLRYYTMSTQWSEDDAV